MHQDGTPTRRAFVHLESEIGAEEAEEIGVEHLLRDIKDATVFLKPFLGPKPYVLFEPFVNS